MDNGTAATAVDRLADLLETQRANRYRVDAWRAAAVKVRAATVSLRDVAAHDGVDGLKRVLGVGEGVASALRELVTTGTLRMLERAEGRLAPEDVFLSVPGIGPTLANTLHARLGLETLEDLEAAAHDGTLARVPGFGPRRVALVRDAVAGMLQRSYTRVAAKPAPPPHALPDVATLLEIDAAYRAQAERGELPLINPTRLNPEHVAWLPVQHAERAGFRFTALFSNTERAHRLNRTHDWVVIYFERHGHQGQCTVVTETYGPRAGQRVVRGREEEQLGATDELDLRAP